MYLDILLNDNNEFLRDMLGRSGKLINVGDLYMFQPLEINNTNLSLHQREMPLMFKPKKLEFSIPLKITENIPKKEKDIVIIKLVDNYNDMLSDSFKRNDFNYARLKLIETYEIKNKKLLKYFMEYYIDTQSLNSKIEILNKHSLINDRDLIELINNYYDKFKLKDDVYVLPDERSDVDKIRYVILTKNSENKYIINKEKHYSLELINKFNLNKYSKEDGSISKNLFKRKNIEGNKYIGFFDVFRKNSIVFKYKELVKTNNRLNKGKQCGLGQNKSDILSITKYLVKKMNMITDKSININNLKATKLGNKKSKDISSKKYCFLIYFMLKYLDENTDNRYFFNILENFLFKVSEF